MSTPESPDLARLPALQRVDLPLPALGAIAQGFLAVGADSDFSGTAELGRRLGMRIRLADRMGLPGVEVRDHLVSSLETLAALEGTPRAPLMRLPPGGQPAGPAGSYPIIRCLLIIPSPEIAARVDRLQAILVAAALLCPDDSHPPVLAAAAAEIRLAAPGGGARSQVIEGLQLLDAEPLDLAALGRALRYVAADRAVDPIARGFSRTLDKLVGTLITLSVVAGMTRLRWEPIAPDADWEPSAGDLVELVHAEPYAALPASETAEDAQVYLDDDLEPVYAWVEDPSRIPIPMAPRDADATARGSAHWLPIYRRALPWDRRVLAPPQRDVLLQRVRTAASLEPGSAERWPAMISALMLATGLEPDEIAALSLGVGQTLDPAAGIYRRVPPASGSTASSKHQPSEYLPMGAVLELPLPESVVDLLPSTEAETVGAWLEQHCPTWRETIESWLSALDPHDPRGPTSHQVARCLPFALRQLTGDLALTHLLSGMERHRPPVELRYTAFPGTTLTAEYRRAIGSIFADDSVHAPGAAGDEWFGCPRVARPEVVRTSVERLIAQTRDALDDKDPVTSHNRYVAYVALHLMAATGHRPVLDPFALRSWHDTQRAQCIIDDKASTERHRHRLACLPPGACAQIGAYEAHLRGLATALLGRDPKDRRADAILAMLEGREDCVPYLFLIGNAGFLGLSRERLQENVRVAWPLPLNESRRQIATRLRLKGLDSHAVSVQMGHLPELTHFFGASAVRSPEAILGGLAPALQMLLDEDGWICLEGLPAPAKARPVPRSVTACDPRLHESSLFGPVRRESERTARLLGDRVAVRRVVDTYLRGTEGNGDRITDDPERIRFAQATLLDEARADSASAHRRMRRLARYLDMGRRAGDSLRLPRVVIPMAEDPPFAPEHLGRLARFTALADAFFRWLAEPAPRVLMLERHGAVCLRIAEVVLCAALRGSVADAQRLRGLGQALGAGSRPIALDGLIILDIPRDADDRPHWRWFPDPLSSAMLVGLRASQKSAPGPVQHDDLSVALTALLTALGTHVGRDPWGALAELANARAIHHLPPYLAAVAAGRTPVQPWAPDTLARLLRGQRLVRSPVDEGARGQADPRDPWMPPTRAIPGWDRAAFIASVRRVVRESIDAEPEGTRRRAGAVRRVLREGLIGLARAEGELPNAAGFLLAWGVALANHGTRFKSTLKPNTIRDYLYAVMAPLLGVCGDRDLRTMTSEELEDLYAQMLDYGSTPKRRAFIAGRCGEFHAFVRYFGVEEIDSSVFGGAAPESVADANLVTPEEYRLALGLILGHAEIPERERIMYAAMLILGYRFGLRVGEARDLQVRDIRYRDEVPVYLDTRGNVFGDRKSPAGTRRVPLAGTLSEQETEVMVRMHQWAVESLRDDDHAVYLRRGGGAPREGIPMDIAQAVVHAALRQVSGDPGARYHHLRRSWLLRLMVTAIGPDPDRRPWKDVYARLRLEGTTPQDLRLLLTGSTEFDDRTLYALSLAIGHRNLSTTIASYVHMLDAWISSANTKPPGTMSDHALAVVLGKQVAAVKRMRARLGVRADDPTALIEVGDWAWGLGDAPIKTRPHPAVETLDLVIEHKHEERAWTLEDLDRLLCAVEGGNDLQTLARVRAIPVDRVRQFLATARKLERITGFVTYGLTRAERPQLGGGEHSAERKVKPLEMQPETGRLRRVLRDLAHVDLDQPAIALMATAWVRARWESGGKGSLVFRSPEDLSNYLQGLGPIGLTPECFVATTNAELLAASDIAVAWPAVTYAPKSDEKFPRAASVRLSLASGTRYGYQRTVDRVLFLVGVAVGVDLRAAL